MSTPAQLVAAFGGVLYARDWDGIREFFGEDSVYWDVPLGPAVAARGPDGIVARLRTALDGLAAFDDDPIRTVAQGDTVITEHNEIWRWASGETLTLPITSVQVVGDGVITLWKDYWDYQTLLSGAPASWQEQLAQADMSWIFDATGTR
jgi:limonene-1,2-epoxide hydrolase